MNTRLLNLAPLLIVVGVVGYAAYSIRPADPGAIPAQTPSSAPGDQAARAGVQLAGTEEPDPSVPGKPPKKSRDPFRTVAEIEAAARPKSTADSARKTASPPKKTQIKNEDKPPPSGPYAAKVQVLTLNATFLQGRDELAVIDGRIYRTGQSLEGTEGARIPLRVTKVSASQVILQAGDTRYSLGYPALGETARAPAPVASRVPATAGPSCAMVALPGLNLNALDAETEAVVEQLFRAGKQ